jgi:hypothetical protein
MSLGLLDGQTKGTHQSALNGMVQAAKPGAVGFDTDTVLTASTASAFVTAGFAFVVRYLSLGSTESTSDLTTSEAETILQAGLALSAVQHVPYSGWSPTAQLGTEYGRNAAHNAQSVGLPAGMNVWLDLEGVISTCPATDVTAYCNAWFGEVSAAGFVPGLYVGAGAILDSDQLSALDVQYFWKSGSGAGSRLPGSCFSYPSPSNGYCMVQRITGTAEIDGVSYDGDVTRKDNAGQTPLWLTKGTSHTGWISHPASHSQAVEPAAPSSAPPPSSASVKSRNSLKVLLLVLAGILLYSAGVVTGQRVITQLQTWTGHSSGR